MAIQREKIQKTDITFHVSNKKRLPLGSLFLNKPILNLLNQMIMKKLLSVSVLLFQ